MNYNFFLEIYSEEIPYLLQSSARNQLIKIAENNFKDNIISFKTLECLSTPKRLVLLAEEMFTNIILPSKVIKGPRVGCNDEALAGFMKSQSINKEDLIEEDTEKGRFYFYKSKKKDVNTIEILQKILTEFLSEFNGKNQ